MGQEFRILQCFSCDTYQVHQTKKTRRWQCKLCGERQSILKIHMEGAARELRTVVMKLNSERSEVNVHELKDSSDDKGSEARLQNTEEKPTSSSLPQRDELSKSELVALNSFILFGLNDDSHKNAVWGSHIKQCSSQQYLEDIFGSDDNSTIEHETVQCDKQSK